MTIAVPSSPADRIQFSPNVILNGLYRRNVSLSNDIKKIRNAVDLCMGRDPTYPSVEPIKCRDPEELSSMYADACKRVNKVSKHITQYKIKHRL